MLNIIFHIAKYLGFFLLICLVLWGMFALGVWFIFSRNTDKSGYQIENKKVYYNVNQFGIDHSKTLLEGADVATFVELGKDFAKDANHVYYYGVLFSADAKTFTLFPGEYILYAKDASHVFYANKMLIGADPKTFTVQSDNRSQSMVYGKDAQHIFFFEEIVKGADPESFKLLGDGWWKDKKHVGLHTDIVPGIDIETFAVIHDAKAKDSGYPALAKDKNHIYDDNGKIVSDIAQ